MFSERNKTAVTIAHEIAKRWNKPYLRLCADIKSFHPYPFEEVSSAALFNSDGFASCLGLYEELIRPYTMYQLERNNFSYSLLEIDSIKRNNIVNASLWLTIDDLHELKPEDYFRALDDVNAVSLFEKVDKWSDVKKEINDEKTLDFLRAIADRFNIQSPPLFRIIYGSNEYPSEIRIGNEFLNIYPGILHFYNGTAPTESIEMIKEIRRNPRKYISITKIDSEI